MAGKRSSRKHHSKKKTVGRKATGKKKARAKKARAKRAPPRKAPARKTQGKKGGTAKMTADSRVQEIQRIMDVMVRAGAVEVEMEEAGSKLRVRLKEELPPTLLAPALSQPVMPAALPVAASPLPLAAAAETVGEEEGEVFLSPMVGTFYRAASPEAEAFVEEGDMVSEDSTLCIIEAMKVMNEIKAELEGKVVSILVENGEPVEFGQPLFRIER